MHRHCRLGMPFAAQDPLIQLACFNFAEWLEPSFALCLGNWKAMYVFSELLSRMKLSSVGNERLPTPFALYVRVTKSVDGQFIFLLQHDYLSILDILSSPASTRGRPSNKRPLLVQEEPIRVAPTPAPPLTPATDVFGAPPRVIAQGQSSQPSLAHFPHFSNMFLPYPPNTERDSSEW